MEDKYKDEILDLVNDYLINKGIKLRDRIKKVGEVEELLNGD